MTSKVDKQSKQQEAYGLPGAASHHLEQDSAWKQWSEARIGPEGSASPKWVRLQDTGFKHKPLLCSILETSNESNSAHEIPQTGLWYAALCFHPSLS